MENSGLRVHGPRTCLSIDSGEILGENSQQEMIEAILGSLSFFFSLPSKYD